MDQIALVERRIEDGQRLVQQLARDRFDVTAAFWLRTGEDGWWHLYIASKVVDRAGPGEAYRALQTSQGRLPGTTISLADVKLIDAASPVTADVRRLQKKGGGEALHYRGPRLGNLAIEEAYIYPPVPATAAASKAMTPQEVAEKVFRLMSRPGPVQPSAVVLRDGRAFHGVPYGLELSDEGMTVKFLDSASPTPRVMAATDILEIN